MTYLCGCECGEDQSKDDSADDDVVGFDRDEATALISGWPSHSEMSGVQNLDFEAFIALVKAQFCLLGLPAMMRSANDLCRRLAKWVVAHAGPK